MWSPGPRLCAGISSLGRQDKVRLTNHQWWDIDRKWAGRVRKVAVDRLEVMQQQGDRPEPTNLGLHVTNILRMQIFVHCDLLQQVVE